jgi:hypothetical protein
MGASLCDVGWERADAEWDGVRVRIGGSLRCWIALSGLVLIKVRGFGYAGFVVLEEITC